MRVPGTIREPESFVLAFVDIKHIALRVIMYHYIMLMTG